MEAKDTLTSADQLVEVWLLAIETPDKDMSEPLKQAHRRKAIAQAQAEISFKAGVQEVVEWIEEHQRMTYEYGKGEVAFNHINWHTKLKEWGL